MNQELEERLNNVLKEEAKKAVGKTDIEKMNDIYNMKKILDSYDELEPVLKEFFHKKTKERKNERGIR